MPSFPLREADIMALAQRLISGISASPADFPSPPVLPDELAGMLSDFGRARDTARDAAAAAQMATAEKTKEKERLVRAMKRVIRYAESAAYVDDVKLGSIGWGAKRRPRRLEPPGQVINLETQQEGPGWIMLEWKAPPHGGEVAAYEVRRYREADKTFESVGTAVEPRILLNGQDRKVEWHYTVVAVNKAGTGMESNRVTAVL